jgi:hypothetical protein
VYLNNSFCKANLMFWSPAPKNDKNVKY